MVPPPPPARTLLILFTPHLDSAHLLAPASAQATSLTDIHLRIVVVSHIFDEILPTPYWDELQRLLTVLYAESTRVAQSRGDALFNVEVVLQSLTALGGVESSRHDDVLWDQVLFAGTGSREEALFAVGLSPDINAQQIQLGELPASGSAEPKSPRLGLLPSYDVVALGGTFDHLHAGHKILLSMSAWIASKKVIVGITDDALLTKKLHKELMEPLPLRTDRVRAFLNLFKPGLQYDVVPISDVYGPTGWDPDIQALVVSKETLSGADAIAKLRSEKGLSRLETFVIDVISPTGVTLEESEMINLRDAKMSSTWIRQMISEQLAAGR